MQLFIKKDLYTHVPCMEVFILLVNYCSRGFRARTAVEVNYVVWKKNCTTKVIRQEYKKHLIHLYWFLVFLDINLTILVLFLLP